MTWKKHHDWRIFILVCFLDPFIHNTWEEIKIQWRCSATNMQDQFQTGCQFCNEQVSEDEDRVIANENATSTDKNGRFLRGVGKNIMAHW